MTEPSLPEESIFAQALEIVSAAERAAFLDRACANNPALRAEVEALLHAHEQSDDLLDRLGKLALTTDLPTREGPGTLVGPYKLLEQIGEGGMGTVWMAEQTEPIQRRVAVKVVKEGMDSRQVLARFEAERQALALMEHPNIAKVLDAGRIPSGRPYFVMELVKGKSITKYCDDKRLGVRQRLELFGDVCRAVQHAHQKGIIHRDLKPSNVLVAPYDGQPVVKVIDFGVAKATGQRLTDKTLFTGFGAVVGTPEYMSPEQAEINNQDIDTRSDIYALGVLLYELLTGTTPLTRKRVKEAALLEVLRVIREEEPPRPSTRLSESKDSLPVISAQRQTEPAKLTKLVRGELDWIVMKALEKDRNRRYETANGFALDVQRYLADEPVQACPPTAGYRLQKFLRRHQGPVAAVSLIALALIVGVIGTTLGMLRAENDRQKVQRERDDKETARALAATKTQEALLAAAAAAKAAAAEKSAHQAAQKSLEQVQKTNAILASIFRALHPRKEENLGLSLRAQLADQLVRAAELLEGDAVGENEMVARLQVLLGQTMTNLGLARQAIPVLTKARQTFDKLPNAKPIDKLTILNDLAEAYKWAGKLEPAVKLHREAFEQRQATLGVDHEDTLASMNNLANVYREAGKFDLALPLALDALAKTKAKRGDEDAGTLTCMNNLAALYMEVGKIHLALPLYRDTLAKTKAKLGPDHLDTFTSMNNLADALREAGQLDQALPLSVETFSQCKAKLGPNHPATLTSMGNLAVVYQQSGKLDLALSLQLECLERRKVKLGADHPATLTSRNNLALLYVELGKSDLALPLLRETLELAKTTLGPDHPHTLTCMSNLALFYRQAGKVDLAVQLYRDKLAKARAIWGEEHPTTLTTMHNLAEAYYEAGQLDLAGPLFIETLEKREAKLGADHPDTLASKVNLATVFAGRGRFDLAVPLYEEALEKMKALRPDHTQTLTCMSNLGDAYRATKKYAQAVPLVKAALEKLKVLQGPDHRETLLVMNNLGLTYHDAGQLDLALALFSDTLEKSKAKLTDSHPQTLTTMNNLALTFWSKGQFDLAVPLYRETLAKRAKSVGPDHPDTLSSMSHLARVYTRVGQYADAEPLLVRWLDKQKQRRTVDEFTLANTLNALGECQVALKKFVEAEKSLRDSLAFFAQKHPKLILRHDTENLLGAALAGQSKFEEAERLLVESATILLKYAPKLSADSKRRGAAAAQRVIEYYTAQGNAEEADRWRKLRADAFPPPSPQGKQ